MGIGSSKPQTSTQKVTSEKTPTPKPQQSEPKFERKERPKREQKPPMERGPIQISASLIPTDISDPEGNDPCGLFLEGLNNYWNDIQFQKFLAKHEIKYAKAMKKKSTFTGKLYFDSNDERRTAYKQLSGLRDGNRVVFAVPLHADIKQSIHEAERLRARANSDLETRDIRDKVTPWHAIEYPEQLRQKALKYHEIISPIIPRTAPLIEIVPAPDPDNPRNKIELTIGRDIKGEPCIGFVLGSRLQDVIAPIDQCKNVPSFTPAICNKFLKFMKDSTIPFFDNNTHLGLWKYLLIRTGEGDQTLLSVVTFGETDQETRDKICEEFKDDVTSLSVIETDKVEGYGNYNLIQLSGPPTIVEHLRGLKFDISPVSFFQTNTAGAELLFSKVEELAEIDENTVLIDVCCGTGVIGLSMAHKCKAVVGVDIEVSAIEDAKKNALANGITNAEFIAAPAQNVMNAILKKYAVAGNRVVCIVDPPRDGLHKKAARAIRDCRLIQRLVYISCNCDSLVRDSQNILMNPEFSSKPFSPTKWFGVDMFPHTPRCEILMLMQRD